MKNFLKSTAIFACIAFMFCACGEDETVDVGGTNGGDYIETFVESPSDVVVQPGNGVAVLSFTAAEDDDISKCTVAWANNSDDADSGSRTISVTAGESAGYTISGLSAATYTVSVVSVMDDSNKTSTAVSSEVAVYDASTYESQMPEITRMDYDSSVGVTIYLSYVSQDCSSLEVSYYTYAGDYSASTTASVDIADPGAGTILSGAKLGESFTLIGYFKPENGYDYAEVRASGVFEAEDEIGYPEGVAAYAGYKRIMVYWDLAQDDASNIDATYISYLNTSVADASPVVTSYTSWDFTDGNVSQKLQLSGLDAGNYSVSIYNTSEGDAQVNILTIEDVLVYDESSFSLPEISSIYYKSDDKVYITWGETPEHVTDMSFVYTATDDSEVSVPLTDLTATTTLESGAKEGSEIIVSATFHPDYAIEGLDAITADYVDISTVVGEGVKIPEQLPSAPSNVVVTMGYDEESTETNKSQLTISWGAFDSDEEISKIVIYCGVGTSPSSYDAIEVAADATSYTFSELIKGVTYTGYIETQKASGDDMILSEVTADQKFSLESYDDTSYSAALPTYSVTNTLSVDVVFGTLNSDLVSVTVTPSVGEAVTMTRDELVAADNKLSFTQGEATTFTYSATLMPTYGSVGVVLTSETIDIPVAQLTAPTGVAATYGYDSEVDGKGSYITLSWDAPSEVMATYIKSYTIYYTINGGDVLSVADVATTSYSFENIADENLGAYSIYVVSVDTSDNESVASDAVSAEAYGPASYTALPTLVVVESEGTVTLQWGVGSDVSADLASVSYSYGTATSVEILAADLGTEVAIAYEEGYNEVTFTATFKPTDGVGSVVMTGESASFLITNGAEEVTLSALALSTEDAGVVVSWSYGTEKDNISSVVIYYKASTESTYSSKVISGNTDTTYTLNSEDGIVAATTYDIYVVTANSKNTETAAIDGGTSESPLSITVVDLSSADILLVAAGDTYEVDTYEIYTAAGLGAFNDLVSGTSYYDTDNVDTNGTITSWTQNKVANAILMDDIDLSTICSASLGSWAPIGGSYAGTFDGNSKKVSNLYTIGGDEITGSTSTVSTGGTVGFFGYTGGAAIIKNLTIENPTVSSGTANIVAAIAARTSSGDGYISNCHVTGIGTIIGGQNVATIVGTNAATVMGCTNASGITITSTLSSSATRGTGGIVGLNSAGAIQDCVNYASVNGAICTGGIIGYSTGTITASTNYGAVTNTGAHTGGIVGNSTGAVTGDTALYSYNYGAVTGGATATTGGIVGTNSAAGTVSYYKNYAEVVVDGVTMNGSDSDDANKYGVYGANSGTIENCADEYVAPAPAAEAVTVTAPALTADEDGVVVAWTYGETANISSVKVYYKASGVSSYTAKTFDGSATSSVTLTSVDGIATGVTYDIYVVTLNSDGAETAATDGGTEASPLSIEVPAVVLAADNSDIYLYSAGEGSYSVDTYEIRTAAGLVAFEQLVNGTAASSTPAVTTNVTSWSQDLSANAVVMADINLSSVCSSTTASWTPIGTSSSVYAGTFDGNSKTISNLYISTTTSNYQGLFGSIGGVVKNITLYDPLVFGYSYVGALSGSVTANGTVSGCTVDATTVVTVGLGEDGATARASASTYSVYTSNPGNTTYTGGITGLNAGTIVDCVNNVNVGTGATDAGLASSTYSGCYIGGLTGSNTGTIEGSSNSGYVFGRNTVGGIAGLSNSQTALVVGCSNSGRLYSNTYTGGMVGQISNGTIVACYSTGDIDGPTSSAIIGGIVGRDSSSTIATVIGCFSYNGLLGPAYATTATATGYIWGTTTASAIVTSCYFVDVDGDLATDGVKNPNASASIETTQVADVAGLVDVVATMNTAIGTSYGYQFSATTLNADGAPSIVKID